MSDYDGRMGQLAYEDALRFLARRKAEDASLGILEAKAAKAPKVTYDARTYPGKWRASKVRDRCHGAAAMPPTPEAAERLANGYVAPTVLVTSNGIERVADLSEFRPERGESRRPSYEAPSAPEHRTSAADLPALMAD